MKLLLKPIIIAYYLIRRIFVFFRWRITLLKYKYFGRKPKETETAKAKDRRHREDFFNKYCKGKGLDIGFGGDLIVPDALGFDIEHGDATYIKRISKIKFDFVYSSHLLEHIHKQGLALQNWWSVLNPGGFLILYIPHRDLYEKKKTLPSNFNTDHKQFFVLEKDEPPCTIGIISLINKSLQDNEIIYAKVCDENYKPNNVNEYSEGEYSIEVVVKKIK